MLLLVLTEEVERFEAKHPRNADDCQYHKEHMEDTLKTERYQYYLTLGVAILKRLCMQIQYIPQVQVFNQVFNPSSSSIQSSIQSLKFKYSIKYSIPQVQVFNQVFNPSSSSIQSSIQSLKFKYSIPQIQVFNPSVFFK